MKLKNIRNWCCNMCEEQKYFSLIMSLIQLYSVYSLDSSFKPHYMFWQMIFMSSGRRVYKMVNWSVKYVVILNEYCGGYTKQSGIGSVLCWLKMACASQIISHGSRCYYHLIICIKHKRMPHTHTHTHTCTHACYVS